MASRFPVLMSVMLYAALVLAASAVYFTARLVAAERASSKDPDAAGYVRRRYGRLGLVAAVMLFAVLAAFTALWFIYEPGVFHPETADAKQRTQTATASTPTPTPSRSQSPKVTPQANAPLSETVDGELVPGAKYKVQIQYSGEVLIYEVTPSYGGYYVIRSEGLRKTDSLDTFVTLRRSGETEILDEDDDSGGNRDFWLRTYLDDGTTYRYEIRLLGDEVGTFYVDFSHTN